MDDSILGLLACIGIAVLICILVGGLLFGPVYWASSKSCSAKAERLGLEYDYSLFQGCFVKDGDTWVDYDRYRVIDPLVGDSIVRIDLFPGKPKNPTL